MSRFDSEHKNIIDILPYIPAKEYPIDESKNPTLTANYRQSDAYISCHEFLSRSNMRDRPANPTDMFHRALRYVFDALAARRVIYRGKLNPTYKHEALQIRVYDKNGKVARNKYIDGRVITARDDKRVEGGERSTIKLSIELRNMLDILKTVYDLRSDPETLQHILLLYCDCLLASESGYLIFLPGKTTAVT